MVPMRIFPKPVYHDQFMFNGRIVGDHAGVHRDQPDSRWRPAASWSTRTAEEVATTSACSAPASRPSCSPSATRSTRSILIDKFSYVVVGVVSERMPTAGSGGSIAAEDFNNDVYIPLGTAEGRFGKTVFLRQAGSRSGEQVELQPGDADR